MTRTTFCFGTATVSLAGTRLSIHNECTRDSHTRWFVFISISNVLSLISVSFIYVTLLSCQCVTACEGTTKETVSGLCDEYYLFKLTLLSIFISCSIHANFILYFLIALAVRLGSVSRYKDEHLPRFRLLRITSLYLSIMCIVYIFF